MITGQILRFGVVGTVGFCVDAAVLTALLALGLDLFGGRAASFAVAVTTTWYLNRRFTFASTDRAAGRQWARFAAVNLLGGALNYAVYAALVITSPLVAAYPILGVAAGALAGMVSNFTLSKTLVFRQ